MREVTKGSTRVVSLETQTVESWESLWGIRLVEQRGPLMVAPMVESMGAQ